MIAGLPGTGLGGLFYLAAALVMILRGKNARTSWQTLARMSAITFGILAALWLTYWVLGELLARSANLADASAILAPGQSPGVFQLPSIFIATLPVQLASIGLLLLGVELIHLWLKSQQGKKKPESIVAPQHPAVPDAPAFAPIERVWAPRDDASVTRK
ncbi:MAG: hypothetical protein HY741_04440 [Chloroflexi bacterium]|nr:hypothetical protein [Chloroflexota bacterium]